LDVLCKRRNQLKENNVIVLSGSLDYLDEGRAAEDLPPFEFDDIWSSNFS